MANSSTLVSVDAPTLQGDWLACQDSPQRTRWRAFRTILFQEDGLNSVLLIREAVFELFGGRTTMFNNRPVPCYQ